MRRFLPVILLVSLSASAGAQIIRPRYGVREPSAFVSLGLGLQEGWSVVDGSSDAKNWDFGTSNPYTASLEKLVSNGVSAGVRANTASVPLHYAQATGGDFLTQGDADANVSQFFGTLHIANGTGFHSVLELSAGATVYSNFRKRGSDVKFGPATPDTDFSFSFGYGFGYSFSNRFSVDVVQDRTTSVHQSTGLSAGAETSARIQQTRLVGRFGLGGR